MRPADTRLAVIALVWLAVAADLQAAERLWHPYREVCRRLYLEQFYAAPLEQRDKLVMRLKFERSEGGERLPGLAIASTAGRIDLVPDARGLVAFPVNAELLVENPPVLTDAPAGRSLNVSLSVQPLLPAQDEFAYAELMEAVEQANAMVTTRAGLLGWFSERFKGVLLQYAEAAGQTARIGLAGSTLVIGVDRDGALRLPFDQELLRRNPRVRLSQHPQSADFLE